MLSDDDGLSGDYEDLPNDEVLPSDDGLQSDDGLPSYVSLSETRVLKT